MADPPLADGFPRRSKRYNRVSVSLSREELGHDLVRA